MNRSQSMGWRNLLQTVALRAGGLALLCLAAGAGDAQAYAEFRDSSDHGCVDCHDGFKGGGLNWLHSPHVDGLRAPGTLATKCTFCHQSFGGDGLTKYTYTSGSGYGCLGCHGQVYYESGLPKARGYGLRAVHARKGVTVCAACHDPGSAILQETSPPPYYGMPGSKLTDPCDSTQEAFAKPLDEITDFVGLDNDGNGLADFPLDPNCAQRLLDPNCSLQPDPSCNVRLHPNCALRLVCQ